MSTESDRLWGRRRVGVVVPQVGGNHETRRRGGLEVQTFDWYRRLVKNATVEGRRAAFEEACDLASCADWGPSAARTFEGESLR